MKRRTLPANAEEITIRCPNEECEVEITVHVYPEAKETREIPGFPATIDVPRLCPACGVVIDNETADRWLTALIEVEPLDDDERREGRGDFK